MSHRNLIEYCCLFRFGAVFLWDTGSSVGEIVGHSKIINSVDIKQTRPYRLVTGSDDNCTTFLEGPPFKYKSTTSVSFSHVWREQAE